jgi:hypothetical protein
MGRKRGVDFEPLAKLVACVVVLAALAGGTRGFAERLHAITTLIWTAVVCLLVVAVVSGAVILFLRSRRNATRVSRLPSPTLATTVPVSTPTEPHSSVSLDPTPRSRPEGGADRPVSPDDWTGKLRALDWFQFEKLMQTVYARKGYSVEARGGANPDGGVDLVIQKSGNPVAVQCKHWRTRDVGVRQVRELCGAMTDLKFQVGVMVTLNGFTPDAKALAARNRIHLVDETELLSMLQSLDLPDDPELQACLTNPDKCCPKCGKEMKLRTAKSGPNPGGQFWGCSSYPRCIGLLPA